MSRRDLPFDRAGRMRWRPTSKLGTLALALLAVVGVVSIADDVARITWRGTKLLAWTVGLAVVAFVDPGLALLLAVLAGVAWAMRTGR